MKRNLLVLFFAISLLISISLAFRPTTAQTQGSSASNTIAKLKWEYCAISSSGTLREGDFAVGYATIVYFDASGNREENVKKQGESVAVRDISATSQAYDNAKHKALAITIAQLGDQGWEMVGQLPFNGYFRSGSEEPTAIYFKRTKP